MLVTSHYSQAASTHVRHGSDGLTVLEGIGALTISFAKEYNMYEADGLSVEASRPADDIRRRSSRLIHDLHRFDHILLVLAVMMMVILVMVRHELTNRLEKIVEQAFSIVGDDLGLVHRFGLVRLVLIINGRAGGTTRIVRKRV